MANKKKSSKGKYVPISIPLIAKKEWNEDKIKSIKEIQRQAIDNFIEHMGVEIIPFGKSGNPETVKKGWGYKKN
jgi:hypothetical protein